MINVIHKENMYFENVNNFFQFSQVTNILMCCYYSVGANRYQNMHTSVTYAWPNF